MFRQLYSGEKLNEYLVTADGVLTAPATLSSDSITASSDGSKYINKGTVLATITSGSNSGLVGPYASAATDGRESTSNIVGICNDMRIVDFGDTIISYAYQATVREDKIICDGVMGSVSDGVKSALRTSKVQILFR